MRFSLFVVLSGFAVACGDEPAAAGSASAKASSAPPKPVSASAAAPSASASAAGETSTLPGTALKDVLKDTEQIMGLGPATSPMGVMNSDKKDIAAILAAIGTDQQLSKGFGAKCITPIKLAFQGKGGKSLGMLGFCDKDDKFATGRFDGSGAEMASVEIKNPTAFKALLTQIGVLKK